MPIFEYECRKCAHRFEALVMGGTRPDCPSCRSRQLAKLVSAFAVGHSVTGGSMARESSAADLGDGETPDSSGGACGTCGDPRGPGSCAID
jgi:putative FmdB family regulatory protein